MRMRNSAMIAGNVRLNSKSLAFSISSASEGGARARVVSVIAESDLRVVERNCWLGNLLRCDSLGSETWGSWSLALMVVAEGGGIRVLEVEAMIMFAMAVLVILSTRWDCLCYLLVCKCFVYARGGR